MRSRTKDIREPIGRIMIVDDFLPPPNKLVFNENNVKITINLRKNSIDFFKRVAKKNRTKYQKVIRSLLDQYASHFEKVA